jgi:hypothetical protein
MTAPAPIELALESQGQIRRVRLSRMNDGNRANRPGD